MLLFDSNQCLSFYGSTKAPICKLDIQGSEALALLQANWLHGNPSSPPYIVVLDRFQVPKGLFRAECTLGWQTNLEHSSEAALPLQDLSILPLPAIAASMTAADFLQRICQYSHFAEIWALVDAKGKYVGVLEVLPLLRLVTGQMLAKPNLAQKAFPAVFNDHQPEFNQQLVDDRPNEQLDQTSKQAIAQLVRLIEQLPSPILVFNTEGKVLGMNQLWQDRIKVVELNAISALSVPSAEPVFCTSDGVEHTWQVFRVGLTAEWQGIGVAIAQDITAQRNLAAELSGQNADLIRLNRLKDEFLACISHELKTPLTTIMGMTNLLSSPKAGSLNPDQSRYIQMVHRSSRNLTTVIDNIVDMAKAETGQLQIMPRTLDIRGLCDRSILHTQNLFQTTDYLPQISLQVDDCLTTLVADEKRLQQMLVSLLSNAFKFSEDYEDAQVCLQVCQWEGWIAFTVSDRGMGIPEDKQHLLFQKFQQLESTRTRRFDGTGLGLVLTRHLARLHGGDVTFVSQEGMGSEFTILLPPLPPQTLPQTQSPNFEMRSPIPETSPSPDNRPDNRLVLIVETSPADVEQMMTVLTAWGYRIVVARTGTEALEKARRLQPCLILLSPNLPSLSGWDVLALLKQDSSTSQIRAIMALQSQDQNWEWGKYPADGFFLKPVQPSSLSIFLPHHNHRGEPLKILTLGKMLSVEIGSAIQSLSHHLLEAEDGEQGEVLAKIWHPDLIVLEQNPDVFLTQVRQSALLAKLPVLIFGDSSNSLKATFPDLKIMVSQGLALTPAKLNRLLERTVGHIQTPTVLLLDLTGEHVLTRSLQNYLMLGGIQVHLLDQPQTLAQQLDSYGADALLVTLHDREHLSETEQATIRILNQAQFLPPIIVLDGRSTPESTELISQLLQMSTRVLQQPNAIADLLTALRNTI